MPRQGKSAQGRKTTAYQSLSVVGHFITVYIAEYIHLSVLSVECFVLCCMLFWHDLLLEMQ